MKTLRNILLLFVATLFITSCDERNYNAPPINEPVFEYDGQITTIQELKNMFAGEALKRIDEPIVIRGRVVANDISGNLYQKFHLQDESAGIEIRIERRNAYSILRVGQEVFITCQGLDYGEYGTFPQLGFEGTNQSLGLIPNAMFERHIHLNGWPKPELAKPIEVSIDNLNDTYIGKLVTVTNVQFQQPGQPFAVPRADGSIQTENKILVSATNSSTTLTARNSSAARFASSPMPSGIGSVTGVLSVFHGTRQITFRDYDDASQDRFFNYGTGTATDPWIIKYVLENQGATPIKSGWIQGYIVGAVKPGIHSGNPITSSNDIIFGAEGGFNQTVVLAASADERDWNNCVVVDLSANPAIQSQLNLMDNPANLGKKLKIAGNLENVLGAAGLTNITDFAFEAIFLETFGTTAPTSGARPDIAEYTGYDNGAPIAFTGNTDVRATVGLNNQGRGSHVWFATWSEQYSELKYLTISGINTADASDLKLSFYLAHNQSSGQAPVANVVMTVTVKDVNTGVETSLTVPATSLGTVSNTMINVSNITGIPVTSNLEITFQTTQANTMGIRLDNVRIDGVR